MHGQILVDTVSKGYFGDKTVEEVMTFMRCWQQIHNKKMLKGRKTGMHEVNTTTSLELASMVDELSRKMNLLIKRMLW